MDRRLRRSRRLALAAVALTVPAGCDAGSDAPAVPDDAPPSPAAVTPAPSVEADGLTLTDLVVAEPVTGERTAFYLTVRSRADADDALVGVEVEGVREASLHRTEREGDVSRMRPVDEVVVPAGGEARLRPGGYHGMLVGLADAWTTGDTVTLRLRFRNAGPVEAPALVVPYAELPDRFGGPAAGEPSGDP